MSSNTRLKPKQRYICSHCFARETVADVGLLTRAEGVAYMESRGWVIWPGEAICDKCQAAELRAGLEQSTAVLDVIGAAKRAGGAR